MRRGPSATENGRRFCRNVTRRLEAGTWRYGSRESLAVHVGGSRAGTWRDFERTESLRRLDSEHHSHLPRHRTHRSRYHRAAMDKIARIAYYLIPYRVAYDDIILTAEERQRRATL